MIRTRSVDAVGPSDHGEKDAVAMLHEAATGGMRELDRLSTGCLREAARRKEKFVERDLLPRVIDRNRLERDA